MLTTLNGVKFFVTSKKWQCYFESEIVAWVFIWYPGNDNIGHASMLIGDLTTSSTYVSWWPSKKIRGACDFFSKCASSRDVSFNKETHNFEYKTSSYIEDCLSEKNCPHVIYGLRSANVRDMEAAWYDIVSKKNSSFTALNKNCASIVSRVLKAGFRGTASYQRVFGLFGGDQYIWTPKRIAVVCNQLRDNNVAWKIEIPGRTSEKTFLKTIARLR